MEELKQSKEAKSVTQHFKDQYQKDKRCPCFMRKRTPCRSGCYPKGPCCDWDMLAESDLLKRTV